MQAGIILLSSLCNGYTCLLQTKETTTTKLKSKVGNEVGGEEVRGVY